MSFSVLLLQARHPGDSVGQEELQSFALHSGLKPESFVAFDLLAGPLELETVLQHDALMIGGAGEFYVSKGDLPFFQKLLQTLREVAAIGHPTFASCFGFQCLVQALGGEVVHDPEQTEVGTFELRPTSAARLDEIFSSLPTSFQAQLGRKDRALHMPQGVPNLASSELCPHQALRLPGKPIWATQFHPELDAETNLSRYRRYIDGYTEALEQSSRPLEEAKFEPSPEASRLLALFVEYVRNGNDLSTTN